MPALSFRLKLLLAMMFVVVGVTGTTLYLTEQRVQATYQNLFREQFASQISLFTEMEAFRLSTITNRCLVLAKSVRLQEALRENEAEDVYQNAKNELREVLAPAASDQGNSFARLYFFLDAQGKVLPPPAAPEPSEGGRPEQAVRAAFGLITHALKSADAQQVGYLNLSGAAGEVELIEFIVTKIIDATDRTFLGALVLGFPMVNFGEDHIADTNRIKTAFFLDGRLHSQDLPAPSQRAVAQRLAEEIKAARPAPDDLEMILAGTPHRVFYRPLNAGSGFPTAYLAGFYSLDRSLRERADLRRKILGFGALALAGGLAVILLLSQGLTVPIRQLVAGTREIQRGNFQVKIPVRSRDEIGWLARSFNEMAEGLALKEKYRSVLNKVSDKRVAEELMKGEVVLGGETRDISVLFCDIRGFTALTQNMAPAEVIHMLNEHFTPLARLVDEHNGFVDKFVGDLIMAVFGAPKSHGNDALNAARCALAMLRERATLNESSRYQIKMGIGVASGPAVAGCMGSADRLNYTVLGTQVNLASRLCSKAGRMEVVIDESTLKRLGESCHVDPLAALELKGFSDRVPAFKLLEIPSALLNV